MAEHIEAGIAFANRQLGKPYVFGTSGPDTFDCIGLDRKIARAMGYDGSEFPAFINVRQLTAWAEANGYLRLAAEGYAGERGDFFLWGDANSADHRPRLGAGHTGLVKRAPTAAKPNGKAISALNPDKGVINHGIAPKPGGHLALYGFVVVPPPLPEPAPAPETPPPGSDTVEPDDDGPEVPPAPTPEETIERLTSENVQLAAELVEVGQEKQALQERIETKDAKAKELIEL